MSEPALADVDPDDLPEQVADLVELIGLKAALRIVERWGGIRLYFPERVRADHPIAQAIGTGKARQLSEQYGRTELHVPRAHDALLRARNRRIRSLHIDHAWPAGRIARRYGLTERQIYSILANADTADDRQAALF